MGRSQVRRKPAPAWSVYLIECRGGGIYTGVAIDVLKRYGAHARGKGARYTRAHPPRKLLAILEFPNRSTATQAESRIKRLSAAEKRALCRRLDRRRAP